MSVRQLLDSNLYSETFASSNRPKTCARPRRHARHSYRADCRPGRLEEPSQLETGPVLWFSEWKFWPTGNPSILKLRVSKYRAETLGYQQSLSFSHQAISTTKPKNLRFRNFLNFFTLFYWIFRIKHIKLNYSNIKVFFDNDCNPKCEKSDLWDGELASWKTGHFELTRIRKAMVKWLFLLDIIEPSSFTCAV